MASKHLLCLCRYLFLALFRKTGAIFVTERAIMKMQYLFVLMLVCICRSASAQSENLVSRCDFCLCSQGISPLELGGSAVRFDVRYTRLATPLEHGVRVTNPTNVAETYLTNQLSFTYGLAHNLSAIVIVPYARKTESFNDPEIGARSFQTEGLGDLSLLARYNILADHEFADTRILSVTGGFKFATGRTDLLDGDEPADADLQLGTGTTDVLVGAGYLLGFEHWSISTNVLTGIRGFGTGANGHVYGNNLNYDVTGRYQFFQSESERTLFGALALRGEWRGMEIEDGQKIDNSGGNVLYAAPGLQFFYTPAIVVDAAIWIPVSYQLNGSQLGETVKLLAGLQWGL